MVIRGEERTQIRYQGHQRTLVTLVTKQYSDQSEHWIHGHYLRAFFWSNLDMNHNKVYQQSRYDEDFPRMIAHPQHFSQQQMCVLGEGGGGVPYEVDDGINYIYI